MSTNNGRGPSDGDGPTHPLRRITRSHGEWVEPEQFFDEVVTDEPLPPSSSGQSEERRR